LAGLMEYEFPATAGAPAGQKSLGDFG